MTLYRIKVSTPTKQFYISVRANTPEVAKVLARRHSSWFVEIV